MNLEQRNALQNAEFERWVEKTRALKRQYSSGDPFDEQEHDSFILEFTAFAAKNFTPHQIKSFQGMESGAGGEMFSGAEELPDGHKQRFIHLGLIEYWLLHYIDLNRKAEEPTDLGKMFI